jgi:hypothetical protein
VERDDRRAVELLLRGGADPARLNSALETTAVHVAAAQAKTDILNMFIGKFFLETFCTFDNLLQFTNMKLLTYFS